MREPLRQPHASVFSGFLRIALDHAFAAMQRLDQVKMPCGHSSHGWAWPRTADREGRCDRSLRCGEKEFVHVLDASG
jgi:hypothetical protein